MTSHLALTSTACRNVVFLAVVVVVVVVEVLWVGAVFLLTSR